MPTPLAWRKAASGRPLARGRQEPPESLARGTLPQGFPRNLGELSSLLLQLRGHGARLTATGPAPAGMGCTWPGSERASRGKVPAVEGDRRRPGRVGEQSYDPIVPVKVGNWGDPGPTGGKGGTDRRIG